MRGGWVEGEGERQRGEREKDRGRRLVNQTPLLVDQRLQLRLHASLSESVPCSLIHTMVLGVDKEIRHLLGSEWWRASSIWWDRNQAGLSNNGVWRGTKGMTGSVLLMADGTGAKVGLSLAMVKTCRWPDQAPGCKKDLVPKLPLSAQAHALTHAYTLTKTVTTNARAHIHKHHSHTFSSVKLDIQF